MIQPLISALQQTHSPSPSERIFVHLVAMNDAGLAYMMPSASKRNDTAIRSMTSFSHLTNRAVEEWLIRRNKVGQVIGGFQLALDNAGLWLLKEWIEREHTIEPEKKLALPLRKVADALLGAMDTLHQAICWMYESWQAEADILSGGSIPQHTMATILRERSTLPLEEILTQKAFRVELGWFLREAELEVLLPQLSNVIMTPLRQWLNALQLDDPAQSLTLIAHDRLSRLPLQDALVPDKHTGKMIPFHETCQLTPLER